jgi:hypothetical protein
VGFLGAAGCEGGQVGFGLGGVEAEAAVEAGEVEHHGVAAAGGPLVAGAEAELPGEVEARLWVGGGGGGAAGGELARSLGAEDGEGLGLGAEVDVGVVGEEGEAGGVFDGGVEGGGGEGGVVLVAAEPGVVVGEGFVALDHVAEEDAEAAAAAGDVREEGVGVGIDGLAQLREAVGVEAVEVHHGHAGEAADVLGAVAALHGGGGGEGGHEGLARAVEAGGALLEEGAEFEGALAHVGVGADEAAHFVPADGARGAVGTALEEGGEAAAPGSEGVEFFSVSHSGLFFSVLGYGFTFLRLYFQFF